MAELEVQKVTLLPVAGTITDNDMMIIVQGGYAKRALPSAMKGKKGDPGLGAYLGVNDTYILWKQGANGSWNNLIEIEKLRGPKGEKPIFRKVNGCLMMKYEGQPDTAWVNLFDREELKMKFSDLTPAEVNLLKLHFSDLTAEDIALLQKPSTDAAAEVRKEMVQLSQEVNIAIADTEEASDRANAAANSADQARVSLSESVQQTLTEVDNKMLTVKDGKTALFESGTNTSGADPSITVEQRGVDVQGNPIYKISIVTEKGSKGDKGDTPVFETGTVATGLPGTKVQFSIIPDGQTSEGLQKYKVNATIPQGMPGTGNVTAVGTGLIKDEKYLFVPSTNDESTGLWVKYVEPNNFPEAPEDGKQYARKDGDWSEIQSTGDGIIYPTFEINDDAHLIVNNITDPATFEVNESGHLIFNPQIQ